MVSLPKEKEGPFPFPSVSPSLYLGPGVWSDSSGAIRPFIVQERPSPRGRDAATFGLYSGPGVVFFTVRKRSAYVNTAPWSFNDDGTS